MATRNGGNQIDELEEIRNLDWRIERLIKLKEESGEIVFLSTIDRENEARMFSLVAGATSEVHGSSYFIGQCHDFGFRKLHLPTFDGTNPEEWIMEAERYFNVHQLTNKEKLEAAVISFEGDALRWHEREDTIRSIAHWEAMKILLLREFRSSHMGTHHCQWFATKQEGSVHERICELSTSLHKRSDDVALRKFESGWKPEIWDDFRVLEPTNMGRVMDQAQELKERNMGVDFRAKKLSLSIENRKGQGLSAKELWKGEKKSAKDRDGSPAVSVRESGFGDDDDGFGGGGGSGSEGVFGLFKVAGASGDVGSSIPTVSVSKSGFGESYGVVSGGFGGGGGGSRGCVDSLGVEGGSRRGRSSSLADSRFKSGSVGSLGGDSGGSDGGFHFFGGGGGLDSGGSGMAVGIYFPTWEKPSRNRVEELNRESEADFSTVLGTEPLVLLRPLRDILGACLQIGMVESLGKKMQWRECRRRKQSSRLMGEDCGKRKATQWDQSAQVAPAAVSYFPP